MGHPAFRNRNSEDADRQTLPDVASRKGTSAARLVVDATIGISAHAPNLLTLHLTGLPNACCERTEPRALVGMVKRDVKAQVHQDRILQDRHARHSGLQFNRQQQVLHEI